MSTTTSNRSAPSARLAPAAARQRSIDGIHRAPPLHWVGDGFRVAGYFHAIPDAVRKLSPFLLLDYHPPYDYAPTSTPRGVGVHPHRGFETVTLAWQGSVAHHDSAGGGGIIGPGDVQWMTAASGVLHKEYHEAGYARTGGPFHMAQLWVNLPAAHKMDAPRYQALLAGQMGIVALPGGAGEVRVIAGEYRGVRGPARTFTPIDLHDVRLATGGALPLSFPAPHTAAVLVMKGAIEVQGRTGREGDLVLFARDGEQIAIEARADAHLLVLSGLPIDEPVVQYGPFVMNSQREIVQAFGDLERGAFGQLED
ncbi:MAG TPA: pirin family protein [Kofleriaceae bacterium]|nr:pirin family protein [Kofleriaceae bacterium]